MTTRLALLRHGEAADDGRCAGARFDPPLTDEGRVQAERARQRLDAALGGAPGLVVASPALRARQTAAAWAGEPLVEPRLAERDWGAWEGRAWAELWAEAPDGVADDLVTYLAFRPPGAEGVDAVRARAAQAVAELADARCERVLAVTHAGPLRLAAAALLGLDDAAAFELCARHGAAVVLAGDGGHWRLDAIAA